ncbi:PREDICTED: doublesex- and mab-3-related transcription factor B1-like [Mesitornis unicolor]|uniref:doublesex- and mab-3-related transcription factor B1-like n=1 Tax=Mesitornis unicolor TaxID=54374 RepID=UPI0005284702|nr:PREDICTED: doublesex- and mab-3-related transcription factor B1-like [Mesitornis unicolor]
MEAEDAKAEAAKAARRTPKCDKCALISERQKIMAAYKALSLQEPSPPAGTATGPARPGRSPRVAGAPEQSGQEGMEDTQPSSSDSRGMARRGPLPPPSGPPFCDFVHPAFPLEYVVNPEYLEREPPRVYPGCSGVYPYHPFPMGSASNQSSCQGAPSPPGIPLHRAFRPIPSNHGPGNAARVSIPGGGGDFHQRYYAPLPQFIPPRFLPGIHYVPPPLPLNVLAETTKQARATEADSQDSEVVREPGQPSDVEPED